MGGGRRQILVHNFVLQSPVTCHFGGYPQELSVSRSSFVSNIGPAVTSVISMSSQMHCFGVFFYLLLSLCNNVSAQQTPLWLVATNSYDSSDCSTSPVTSFLTVDYSSSSRVRSASPVKQCNRGEDGMSEMVFYVGPSDAFSAWFPQARVEVCFRSLTSCQSGHFKGNTGIPLLISINPTVMCSAYNYGQISSYSTTCTNDGVFFGFAKDADCRTFSYGTQSYYSSAMQCQHDANDFIGSCCLRAGSFSSNIEACFKSIQSTSLIFPKKCPTGFSQIATSKCRATKKTTTKCPLAYKKIASPSGKYGVTCQALQFPTMPTHEPTKEPTSDDGYYGSAP